ncbi:MAG: polysaccharide biosynthesis/export family protein [Syntrophobacteraceae bacterium]
MRKAAILTVIVAIGIFFVSSALPCLADDYLIGPPDVVEISIWGEPELKRDLVVRPDGRVSFPLAGEIEVAGKTTAQVKELVEKRIQTYIPQANASVIVTQLGSLQFYVIGKVNKPGMYNVAKSLNVLQALSLAGGFTPFAKEGDITIIRSSGKETTRLPFSYDHVKDGKKLEQNIMLKRGDVVLVP